MLVEHSERQVEIDGELGHRELVGVDSVEGAFGEKPTDGSAHRGGVVALDEERSAGDEAPSQVVGSRSRERCSGTVVTLRQYAARARAWASSSAERANETR
jgi:hypothetical protein